MRLKRSLLLEQLAGAHAPPLVLVEAPAGYGKSWLLRKAWGPGALRLRGELGRLHDPSFTHDGRVVIDDAHLLDDDDVARLVEHIEFSDDDLRLFVAGRLLPDSLHEVANLVDGTVLDSTAMSVTVDELIKEVDDLEREAAEQLVDVTDGCIRTIAAAVDEAARQPGTNPVTLASRIIRTSAATALQQLDASDQATVALLARSPGIDAYLLTELVDSEIFRRLLKAGVPLRRHSMAGYEVATGSTFRQAPVESNVARRASHGLVERNRPVDAVELLLDAGDAGEAARLMGELSESVVDAIEPRLLLSMLARLGALLTRDPQLLLIRATAMTSVGRLDDAVADIDAAAAMSDDVTPALKRRIEAEAARAHLVQGNLTEAVDAATNAITGIEAGEERTYARAHQILAECGTHSDSKIELQKAIESFRIAAAAWEASSEHSRSRACRRDMAMGALLPLGRFDEALAQLSQILAALDLTDAERSWTLLAEGFVLVNAGRLDSAEDRFRRVSDIGIVLDNPRLVAAAAWGLAEVSRGRDDLEKARQWIATAENTALTLGDDVLGVPFLCAVAEILGSLGDIADAETYLDRAQASAPLFPDTVQLAEFILNARQGVLGDVDAQLERTPPNQRWRVQLVAAYAAAQIGDLDRARQLLATSERELAAFGFDDATPLGERRTYEATRALLTDSDEPVTRDPSPSTRTLAPSVTTDRIVRVVGSPMRLQEGLDVTPIPPGNPQRLVGVVVANGGSASFDQLSEAMWPGEPTDVSRTRLRNVLLRLRRAVGDIVTRTAAGLRLAANLRCDLHEFERLATDALSASRTDPDLAGQVARTAVDIITDTVLADFEYEEWALEARQSAESKLIGLLDLLSVQAEDEGNLPLAQTLAERALHLDRYADSRYVRLAELLTLQNRTAAAVAVLDDAAAVARELSGSTPPPETILRRRRELLRQAASDR